MRRLSGYRRRRPLDAVGAEGDRPATPAPARRRARLGARLIAASLAGALLASVTAVVGSSPAVAAPGDPAAGPPVDTTVVIQSVGDDVEGAGGGGYQISGTELLHRATPPKGDEDNQWWYLQASAGGTYKVRSRTLDDRCMGRDADAEGAARLAFRDCAGPGTDWEFHRYKGDQYKIRPVGHVEYLQTPAKVDKEDRENGGDVTFGASLDEGEKQLWYVTRVSPTKQAMPADPTFDQRTYLTAHNAFYNQDDADGAAPMPNQSHSIRQQLANGVRGLMLDGYQHNGRVRMCHEVCIPTSRPMSDVFTDIADFLKDPANGNEIVTVFLQDATSYDELNAEIGDDLGPGGQLAGMVFNPSSETIPGWSSDIAWNVKANGWPKVSDMVERGKRLVLFTSDGETAKEDEKDRLKRHRLSFQHDKDWTAENYWSMGAGIGNSDWSCRTRWDEIPLAKEEPKFRRLFVMNHFRDAAYEDTARNDNAKIVNRAQRFCSPAARKKPNFIAVDQYDTSWAQPVPESDALAAVNELNTYTYHDDTPGQGGTPDELGVDWKVPRLTVMPLGDSITEGAGSSTRSSYRAALWPRLVPRAGTLDFVGSLKHGQLPDLDHEGHSGWLIEGLSANIDSWMDQAKPNVVLLHIGTNDMDRDHQVATAPARLAGLIDQMIAASPDTTIVVASLVPSTSPAVQARINAYNAEIPKIVAERQAQKHKVAFVSMASLTHADLKDRLHPNDQGYVKMADVFAEGISQVARKGWISEQVVVKPAPARTGLGDYQVDLNADGRADYLVVDANGAVSAWLNKGGDGRGGWTSAGQVASGVDLAGGRVRFADLNGDGYADYLVVDANGAVRAWLNKGGTGVSGWTAAGQVATGVNLAGGQVRFADLNADRFTDYLVVDPNGAVRAWLNKGGTGTAGWTAAGQIASGVGVPADQVRFADVNADGFADYLAVAADGAVQAWLNQGGSGIGGWTAAGQIATGTGAHGSWVRFADVNADRRADYLVVDANGAVRAWLNGGGDGGGVGGGGWTPVDRFAAGAGAPADQVRFADIDADRRDDYLVVAPDGSVRAWTNNGAAGGWTSVGQIAVGVGAPGSSVHFADLNADARADYLVLGADGSVQAWLNNGGDGKGGWTALGTYAAGVGAPAAQVRFADVNADGRADYLAVADDGSVRAWLNQGGDGSGGWSGVIRLSTGAGAPGSQVRFADLDADGRADYLVVADDGSVKAWLNKDGNGNWTTLGVYAPAMGVPGAQVRFAEANGDGRADYVAVAPDGSARAWLNNGGEIKGGWSGLGLIASGAGAPASQVHI
ncbi:FG-GAP-like repeat-containing protein [Streptomyces sp. V2I9]|uniref:FG-GAP-like repeat-containing protein n=1 Tax=Streptomyces sp. V2I9 TaxID=3042304 RepID=UPI0027860EFC|nr:FG-GAP-like repeat-containing protein [Streptomyces sp. V2I9]MDQ0985267.1 lysophospholipase L1-like esterase [Streptomyces sp. V2I9]